MLHLELQEREFYDELTSTFFITKKESLQLEHSLVSLSKWESKWCKPFLNKEHKTVEETIDYIKCMTITQNVKDSVYDSFTTETFNQIEKYINAPMTATWFSDQHKTSRNHETVTAELIYFWMISYNIPIECQKWHLNRLLTLIRVCNLKNQSPKKQNRKEMLASRHMLNQARKNQLQTKG